MAGLKACLVVTGVVLIRHRQGRLDVIGHRCRLRRHTCHVCQRRDSTRQQLQRSFYRRLTILSMLTRGGRLDRLHSCVTGVMQAIPPDAQCHLTDGPRLSSLLRCCTCRTRHTKIQFASQVRSPIRRFTGSISLAIVLNGLLRDTIQTTKYYTNRQCASLQVNGIPNIYVVRIQAVVAI